MNERTQKIYVTKYALSRGSIQEMLADPAEIGGRLHASERPDTEVWNCLWLSPHEYFLTYEEAVADAEARRIKKIASLKKSLLKFEAMRFGEDTQ